MCVCVYFEGEHICFNVSTIPATLACCVAGGKPDCQLGHEWTLFLLKEGRGEGLGRWMLVSERCGWSNKCLARTGDSSQCWLGHGPFVQPLSYPFSSPRQEFLRGLSYALGCGLHCPAPKPEGPSLWGGRG